MPLVGFDWIIYIYCILSCTSDWLNYFGEQQGPETKKQQKNSNACHANFAEHKALVINLEHDAVRVYGHLSQSRGTR